ncbi:MAG: PKD domain-containing protein [Bacteroidota bacterium]
MKKPITILTLLWTFCWMGAHAQLISTFPYNEDFESFSTCGTGAGTPCNLSSGSTDWVNATDDDIDWTVDVGGTGSGSTGPSTDHNPGTSTGNYLYTEASTNGTGFPNKVAHLISPLLDFGNVAAPQMIFWYHMWGGDMGTMHIDVSTDTGTTWILDVIPSFTDDLNQWQQQVVNLLPYAGDTIQVRFRGITGPDFESDMAIDNVTFRAIPPNNAGVTAITSPTNPLVTGMQAVEVSLENFSANDLDSVLVGWSVNGAVQQALNYQTLIPSFSSVQNVNLGMFNFQANLNFVRAWTSMPNGVMDPVTSNDTSTLIYCQPLNGTYTVGGAAGDFRDLQLVEEALSVCGISGPVLFEFAPGTYAGGVVIGEVSGVSATNTITFDGLDPDSVTITHNGMAPNAVFALLGADYTTITNFTIENTGTVDAWGVRLADTANFNTISNNVFNMSPTATVDVAAVAATASPVIVSTEGENASFTQVIGNIINGGDRGISFEQRSAQRASNNWIIDNIISNTDDLGIFVDDQDSLRVIGNVVRDLRSTAGDGITLNDLQNFTIMRNDVVVPDFGITVNDGNFDDTPVDRGRIINNMARSFTDRAFSLDDVEFTDIFHNTGYGEPGFYLNDFDSLDIRNNVFATNNDFAYESAEASEDENIDFNVYVSLGNSANLIDDGPTLYADLAAWQVGEPGLNVNSAEGDPIFVAPDDLHLLGAVANNVGDNTVGVTMDIDGDTRPLPPATTVDIGADEYTPNDNDALITEFLTDAGGCGDSNTAIILVVQNLGVVTIQSLPVTVDITGGVTTTLSFTSTDPIVFGEVDTLNLGTINTIAGGTYNITAYTSLVGDQDASNDTLRATFERARALPPLVSVAPTTVCENDSVTFTPSGGDRYNFYDAMMGGNLISTGSTYTIQNVTGPDTVYVGYSETVDSLSTIFTGGNGCGGGNMFDITANVAIQIDSLTITPRQSTGNTVSLWAIPNGTFAGNETNASLWTLIGTTTFTNAGAEVPVRVSPGTLFIPGGSTYAIYVEYDASYTNGSLTFSNNDLSIVTGTGLCSSFGGTNAGRMFNGTVHYSTSACTSDRTMATYSITPATTAAFTGTSNEFDATFVNASTNADSVLFDFGDGTISTDTFHTYAATGMYTVTLIAFGECGNDTTTQMLNVTCTPPTAGFTSTSDDLVATFSDTTSSIYATTITYDYGDGNSGTDTTHTYSAEGTYTVCQFVSTVCENDTFCEDITIACVPPVAAFTFTTDTTTVVFSNQSSGEDSVFYLYGDGNTGADSVYTYAASGTYTACLVAVTDCRSDTLCQDVVVIATSTADLINAGSLNIFPNPTKGDFQVALSLRKAASLDIEVVSIQGQQVFRKDMGIVSGEVNERINLNQVSSGLYFVHLTVDGKTVTKKLRVE